MKIRKARPQDIPQLVVLWKEFMLHHLELSRKGTADYEMHELRRGSAKIWSAWARKQMRSRNSLLLVAEDKGSIAGFSMNFIKPNNPIYKVRKLGQINGLYVARPSRRKGIATAFRREAFAWFRRNKVRYACITYHSCNPDAGRIYEGWGFRVFHCELREKI